MDVIRFPGARQRPPSSRQLAALRVVADYTDATGYPPSLAQVALALGSPNKSSAYTKLVGLVACGLLHRDERHARSCVITAAGRMLLDGWKPGAPPGVTAEVVAVDREAAAAMICPECKCVGLAFVPLHHGGRYAGLVCCRGCNFSEPA